MAASLDVCVAMTVVVSTGGCVQLFAVALSTTCRCSEAGGIGETIIALKTFCCQVAHSVAAQGRDTQTSSGASLHMLTLSSPGTQ